MCRPHLLLTISNEVRYFVTSTLKEVLMGNIVLFTLITGWLMWICFDWRRGNEQLKAICEDCDASRAFHAWRDANPDVAVGDSPYAQRLVLQWIEKYKRLLETHSWTKDIRFLSFLDYLYELLNEKGPPPPYKRRPRPKRPSTTKAVLFYPLSRNRGAKPVCF